MVLFKTWGLRVLIACSILSYHVSAICSCVYMAPAFHGSVIHVFGVLTCLRFLIAFHVSVHFFCLRIGHVTFVLVVVCMSY